MTESRPVGRPPKYTSVEEVQEIINDYFANDAYMGEGDSRIFAPTISGLAYALGLTRQGLLDYSNKEQFSDTIKDAKQRVEVALEQRLHGQAVTGTIFNLKNNFGWKDKTESEISGRDGGPIRTDNTWSVEFINPEAFDE